MEYLSEYQSDSDTGLDLGSLNPEAAAFVTVGAIPPTPSVFADDLESGDKNLGKVGKDHATGPINNLVFGSKWIMNHSNEDDAHGQLITGKNRNGFDAIIAALHERDVEDFPQSTTPHFKQAYRDSEKGLLLLCFSNFELKVGAKKYTVKPVSQHKCHFRVQADRNCVIRGNTRANGPGPINLEHSCETAKAISESVQAGTIPILQRKRNAKLGSGESIQLAKYSAGNKADSSKHVSLNTISFHDISYLGRM
jgi:hypothetical protein